MGSSFSRKKSQKQTITKADLNREDSKEQESTSQSAEDDFYTLNIIDYYRKNEETNEIIDIRMEPLITILGNGISLIVLSYLNAIYSILSQSFKLEILYNLFDNATRSYNRCECNIYFNRNDLILAQNKKCYNNKMPLDCVVEVSVKMKNCKLLEYVECRATLSIIYVPCNAKLNVESIEDALQSKDKYKTNVLMQCIQIKFIKPSFSTVCKTKKEQKDLEMIWKNKWLFETSAVTEYLSSNQEYGPVQYTKNSKSCGMTFTHCRAIVRNNQEVFQLPQEWQRSLRYF